MRATLPVVAALLGACAADPPLEDRRAAPPERAAFPDAVLEQGRQYLTDRAYRRAVLEASVVDPENLYSSLRLSNYAVERGGWDALEVWNPPVRPITTEDLGAPLARGDAAPLALPEAWTSASLLELGRRAFEEYPLSVTEAYTLALVDRASTDAAGIWVDDRGRVGGLVAVELAGGRVVPATTCASCHGRVDDGALVHGAASPTLEQGPLLLEWFEQHYPMRDPEKDYLAWGPGHVDPTEDGIDNPTGIPDLRPVRHQSHLNAAATLRNGLIELAIRTETLYITGDHPSGRPPREVAFAIAYYLWSMGQPAPPRELTSDEQRGAELFDRACAHCHRADGATSEPVLLETVGTDPAAGLSPFRGTGYYRVPSLFGVGDRRRLLHRSFLGSLEEMFDPDRIDAVPGHPFGLDLTGAQRADLIAFVKTL